MTEQLTPQQLLSAGKAALVDPQVCNKPYLASALYTLVFIESAKVKTLAVDRWGRCYWNPQYIGSSNPQGVATMLAHEIGHWLRKHHERCPVGESKTRYNYAGDMEINDDLRNDRAMKTGSNWIFPDTYNAPDGLAAEAYLSYLPKDLPDPGTGQADGVGHGDCGSVADGQPREWEDADPANGGAAGVEDIEADLVRRRVAEDIASRGNVPGGLKRWADGLVKPVVPWPQVLRGAVRNACRTAAGATDYTYARPNRHSVSVRSPAGRHVVLPALRKFVPEVAVVIDTSGSMGNAELAHAVAEVEGVLKAVGSDVYVITADTAVSGGVQRVRRAGSIALAGGGGTDMRVPIAAALATPADVVVVVTDCDTPWPERAPGKPVVVVDVSGRDSHWGGEPPAWAKVVRVG